MLVTLGALGVGSLIIVFKMFQGDEKYRSTGLKVCWYKGFCILDDLPAGGMGLRYSSAMTAGGRTLLVAQSQYAVQRFWGYTYPML